MNRGPVLRDLHQDLGQLVESVAPGAHIGNLSDTDVPMEREMPASEVEITADSQQHEETGGGNEASRRDELPKPPADGTSPDSGNSAEGAADVESTAVPPMFH